MDVLKRTKNLNEPASILEAIVATDYHSVVGPIKWSGKPVKNVSKTPLVAGQWRKRDTGFELIICEDTTAPNIKAQDKLRLLSSTDMARNVALRPLFGKDRLAQPI